MLNLIELIQLAGVRLGSYKIHLAKSNENDPINFFYAGTFKKWQEEQTQKNFECEQVISLISIEKGPMGICLGSGGQAWETPSGSITLRIASASAILQLAGMDTRALPQAP